MRIIDIQTWSNDLALARPSPKVLSKHLEKAGFKIVTAKFSTRKYQEIAQMTDERYAGKEDTIVIAVK